LGSRLHRAALLLLLAACILPPLKLSCRAAEAGPRLIVSPESIDLGVLDTKPDKKHFIASFTLSNSGDGVLVLARPRTSCGCTKVQLPDSELAPGQNTSLTVTLDITGRYGRQRFHVFVTSNAPDSPRRLTVEATVPDTRTGWELMPSVLQVRDTSPVRLKVRHFDTDAELRVVAVELPEGCEVVTPLPLLVSPGGVGSIDIRCDSEKVAAAGRHAFAVLTNHSEKPRVEGWLNVRRTGIANTSAVSDRLKQTGGSAGGGDAAAVPIVPIDAAILQQLLASMQVVSDLHVLDVRSAKEYAQGHIPRSVSYPSTDWQTSDPPWPETAMLVVVAPDDEAAERAALILSTTACRHVLTLRGGMPAWLAVAGENSLVTGNQTKKR
jgi:rhodanese-related sulfurtransferase